MSIRGILVWLIVLVILAGGGTAAVLTQQSWRPWLFPQKQDDQASKKKDDAAHGDHIIHLSAQARENIGLIMKTAELDKHPRSLRLPGRIVPRPGRTTMKVSMPITGVVEKIHAYPGEIVRPGDKLFTLHLHYHEIHKTQSELYRTVTKLQINEKEQKRLDDPKIQDAISGAERRQLKYEHSRLVADIHSLEKNLKLHKFTEKDLQQIRNGEFIDERTILVPGGTGKHGPPLMIKSTAGNGTGSANGPEYEVGSLSVKIGDQVAAGKTLCELANHRLLFVEAQVFPKEIPIVQDAIMNAKRIKAVIMDGRGDSRKQSSEELTILYMDQHTEPDSQSVSVFMKLTNKEIHRYATAGKTYLLWKYRPAQRVYVEIPVETFSKVFVLPVRAVAWEGPQAFVFRENGDALERQDVHVLYQDDRKAVVKNDGSILPGEVIAQNGAAQIHRALKMKSGGGGGHHHHHH